MKSEARKDKDERWWMECVLFGNILVLLKMSVWYFIHLSENH